MGNFEKKNIADEEPMALPLRDIFKLSSGKDSMGYPRAGATLAKDEVNGEEVRTLDNIFFKDAILYLYCQGGCAVIACDFPKTATFEYRRARELCEDWLLHLDDERLDDQYLSLTIVPYPLCGEINLFFDNLAYCDGYEKEDAYRLILAFDNNQMIAIESEDCNYELLLAEIEAEIREQEEELDADLEAALAAKREAEKSEEYGEMLKEDLEDIDNITENKELQEKSEGASSKRRGVRFAKERAEDDIR